MSSTLQYRDYEGSVLYSAEDKMLHGRLLCARDIVSYGGHDLAELEVNFRDAVDEYLAFCAAKGKTPDPPKPSALPITIHGEIKAQAIAFAESHGKALDTVVNEALSDYLEKAS
jgi:predicted HicB family RNase H-like nuclease